MKASTRTYFYVSLTNIWCVQRLHANYMNGMCNDVERQNEVGGVSVWFWEFMDPFEWNIHVVLF